MANYHIDYTNGLDTNNGLRYTGYTVDSTSDTTHLTDATLSGYTIGAGSYVWVTGRSGSLVSSFAGTTIVLATAISGLTAGDTYDLILPWKTINKATTTDTRTAGDNIYLRTQASHLPGAVNITFDESGTGSAIISMVGCSTADSTDFWHDGTTTQATIDFSAGAYQVLLSQTFWRFKNILFRNSTNTNGLVFSNASNNEMIYFEGCTFNNATNNKAPCWMIYAYTQFTSCTFQGCGTTGSNPSCFIDRGVGIFYNCTFNATVATAYGLRCDVGTAILYSCSIGVTNTYATCDIRAYSGGQVYLQSCVLGSSLKLSTGMAQSTIYSEDHLQVYGAHLTQSAQGIVTKCAAGLTDTTVRSGGGTSSARMASGSNCTVVNPLTIGGLHVPARDFMVWCPASSTTITIYIRAYGTWSTYPTASQLYIQAKYLTNGTTGARSSSTASTQVISDATTWVAFTTTFTPVVAGFAYITVKLNLYQDTSTGVYVDVKPIVT